MLNQLTPLSVHLMTKGIDIIRLNQKLYKQHFAKHRPVKNKLSSGQVVRIHTLRYTFPRAIHVENTYELFKITRVNSSHVPTTYNLSDLDKDPIQGTIYHEELTPVIDSGLYAIKILKKRRMKKQTQFLVQYINYPYANPKWVPRKFLENLK